MNELSTTVLAEAADHFRNARINIYEGAKLLYQIDTENLWEGSYSSFTEYVEQECQLSRGYASKLLSAWNFYVIEGGVSQRNLEGVDVEKLYLAIKLPEGTAEDRLVKAREWNRQDFKDELSTRDGVECQHPEENHVTICGICSRRVK